MKKITLLCILTLIVPAVCLAEFNTTESLTITTYYPAPYGVYKNLRLFPSEQPAVASGAYQPGTLYFNATDNKLYIFNGSSWEWERVSGDSFWSVTSTDNLNNTNSGNVGIGIATPANKLDVAGNIVATGDVCINKGTPQEKCLSSCVGSRDGVCGPSNGQVFTSAPTSGLCTVGTASSVTGTGPWVWLCEGIGSGDSASCTTASAVNCETFGATTEMRSGVRYCVWHKHFYDCSSGCGNSFSRSLTLNLPSTFSEVKLSRVSFDDAGRVYVNGNFIVYKPPCASGTSPNTDLTSIVHAGANTIRGDGTNDCGTEMHGSVTIDYRP